jgi:hypothetical protein
MTDIQPNAIRTRRRVGRWGLGIVAAFATGAAAKVQSTPSTVTGCYVPAAGTIYRIKAPDLPDECRSPPARRIHVLSLAPYAVQPAPR